MNSNKYIIYPNPSKTNFIIGGNINQIIKIEIFDMNNHCVYYQNINPSDCSLNLEFLNSGMYIYKITENDYSQTGKLVLD